MKSLLIAILCILFFSAKSLANDAKLKFASFQEVYLVNDDLPDLMQRAFKQAGFDLSYEEHTLEVGWEKANNELLDGMIVGGMIEGGRVNDDDLIPIPVTLAEQKFYAFFRYDVICPASRNHLSNYTFLKYSSAKIINTYIDIHYGSPSIETSNVLESVKEFKEGQTVDYVLLNEGSFKYMSDLMGTSIKPCFDKYIVKMDFQPLIHKKHQDKIPALTKALQDEFSQYRKDNPEVRIFND